MGERHLLQDHLARLVDLATDTSVVVGATIQGVDAVEIVVAGPSMEFVVLTALIETPQTCSPEFPTSCGNTRRRVGPSPSWLSALTGRRGEEPSLILTQEEDVETHALR